MDSPGSRSSGSCSSSCSSASDSERPLLIVPTDFSDSTSELFKAANKFAVKLGYDVLLCAFMETAPHASLWLYDSASMVDATPFSRDQVKANLLRNLSAAVKTTFSNDLNVSVCVEDSNGHVAEAIVRKATDAHADLIVIATTGRRGLSRTMLGSVTERVVRTSTIPVLTIPFHH